MTKFKIFVLCAIVAVNSSMSPADIETYLNGGPKDLYKTAPKICKLDLEADRTMRIMYACLKNVALGKSCTLTKSGNETETQELALIEKYLKNIRFERQSELEIAFIRDVCLYGEQNYENQLAGAIYEGLHYPKIEELPKMVQEIRALPENQMLPAMSDLLQKDLKVFKALWKAGLSQENSLISY